MHKNLAPAVLLALLATPVAQAAPAQTSPEAAMRRMYAALAHARTLRYACTFTRPEYGALPDRTTGYSTATVTIIASLEKPNKFRFEFQQGGKPLTLLVSNGRTQYFYDERIRRYVKHALGYGPNLLGHHIPGQSGTPLMPSLASTAGVLPQMQTYLSFFQKDPLSPPTYDPAPARPSNSSISEMVADSVMTVRYESAAPVALDGKPAQRIVGKYSPVEAPVAPGRPPTDYGGVVCYLDPETGLPRRFSFYIPHFGLRFGPDRATSEEDYASFLLGDAPLPAATFTWAPPAGARLWEPALKGRFIKGRRPLRS